MAKKKKKKKNKKNKKIRTFWFIVVLIILVFLLSKLFEKNLKIVEKEIVFDSKGKEKTVDMLDRQGWIKKMNPEEKKKPQKQVEDLFNKSKATFTDLFSSTAWSQEDKTSFRFNWYSKNISFPLDLEVKNYQFGFLKDFLVQKSKIIENNNLEILLIGENKNNSQAEIILWKPDFSYKENKEGGKNNKELVDQEIKKISFKNANISKPENILKIKFLNNSWYLFSQNDNDININILNKDLSLKQTKKIKADVVSPKISCSNDNCLVYDQDKHIIKNLDLNKFKINKITSLNKKITNLNPEQLVFDYNKKTNSWMIATLKTQQFRLWQYKKSDKKSDKKSEFSKALLREASKYPGVLNIKCFPNGKTFLLWTSYFSKVYLIDEKLKVKDLTENFGFRFAKDESMEIIGNIDLIYFLKENKILLRHGGDINQKINQLFWVDYRPLYVDVQLLNQKAKNYKQGLIISTHPKNGTIVYKVKDKGFDLSAIRTIISKKINSKASSKVLGAQIIELEKNTNQSVVRYFLSNNGGKDWIEVDLGEMVKFDSKGNNLKWKAKIAPYKKADLFKPPYFNKIHLQYWYQR